MFFVAKEKIGTILGSQKEFTAATRRGIGFASHGNVWHYFWPADLIESSIRAQHEPDHSAVADEDGEFSGQPAQHGSAPTHYLWSQEVGPGEVIGDPVISPYSGAGDWIAEAKRKFLAARNARLQ